MKKLILSAGLLAAVAQAVQAQSTNLLFTPGRLAVYQLGDGGNARSTVDTNGIITHYEPSDIISCRQSRVFVDEFLPNVALQDTPVHQVVIPTNAVNGGLFVNGNAGTEGCMALAGDGSSLTFCGYTGDLLSITTGFQTAPSNLSYDRGIGLVDAFGNYTNIYSGPAWYGIATGKTNPRGVATDGTNQFWGCGNGYGSLYYNFATSQGPDIFQNVNLTSFIRVQNNQVLATVKGGDVQNGLYPAGLYSFVDFYNNPAPYPTTASYLNLVVPANSAYQNCIGFDMNPQGTALYMADNALGIQKYIKQGSNWKLAYNLSIPGYTSVTNGILATPPKTNIIVGVFSVAVDWSGANPVIYATTADSGFWDSSNTGSKNKNPYYGNRVIKINDTNTATSGANFTNTSIIANLIVPKFFGMTNSQITNLVYKTVTFTPDLRPIITTNPASWSAAAGDSLSFSVAANSRYTQGYQWFQNGVLIPGANSSSLPVGPVDVANYNGKTYQCIVSNVYGSATSSVANLTVTASPVAPTLPALVNVTNLIGANVTLTTSATGTDPKTYQWYHNGTIVMDGAVGDGAVYTGSGTSRLSIANAQSGEAGNYSVVAQNSASPAASNSVVALTLNLAPPVFVVVPASTTTFTNGSASLSATVYGYSLSYQWYTSKTNTAVSSPVLVTDSGDITGSTTPTLQFNAAVKSDATNYFLVVANSAGSVTSAPVTFTVINAPAHSYVNYAPGQKYTQNFDSLPINGGSSADAANPNSITGIPLAAAITNILDFSTIVNTVYSLPNIFDFAYPALGQGFVGGLGLSNTLNGWYGSASIKMAFGATYGDQTAGGIIDLGKNYLGDGSSLVNITNRALGLITSTKGGFLAYGVKFINNSAYTISNINVAFTGELWRNNTAQQVLGFSYALDAAGTNSVFDVNSLTLNPVSSLNVAFPASLASSILDGTQPSNQVSVAASDMPLASGWAPGQALWLVWQSSLGSGGAQAVAIDNLSFSAGNDVALGLSITKVGNNVVVSWPASALSVLQSSTSLNPASWGTVTNIPVVVGGNNTVSFPIGTSKYFRLSSN